METEAVLMEGKVRQDSSGNIIESPMKTVKKTTGEWGMPNDEITLVVGGGYTRQWTPDCLMKELGKDGVVARFYYDKRIAVDVADPDTSLAKKKRKILFKNGFGYLCIPPAKDTDTDYIFDLYQGALKEYSAYEKLNPREPMIQEGVFIDDKGVARAAKVTAIDVGVGGKVVGSVELQQKEARTSPKLSEAEKELTEKIASTLKAMRKARERGRPFRNPFIAKGVRKYVVQY